LYNLSDITESLNATLRYSTLLYATLRYTTLRYSTLLYSTLLYATLRYSTLLYATLRYSTLLYATLRYSTLLYAQFLTDPSSAHRPSTKMADPPMDSPFHPLHPLRVYTHTSIFYNESHVLLNTLYVSF
jgi:hypothetical protein